MVCGFGPLNPLKPDSLFHQARAGGRVDGAAAQGPFSFSRGPKKVWQPITINSINPTIITN